MYHFSEPVNDAVLVEEMVRFARIVGLDLIGPGDRELWLLAHMKYLGVEPIKAEAILDAAAEPVRLTLLLALDRDGDLPAYLSLAAFRSLSRRQQQIVWMVRGRRDFEKPTSR